MLILLSSPSGILKGGTPDPALVNVLKQAMAQGHPTAIVSNHPKPAWFHANFSGSEVEFRTVKGRQNGEFISIAAKHFSLAPYDVLVLAATQEDMQMGKNGGAVLVAAGWSTDAVVQKIGIRVDNDTELQQVITLAGSWTEHWWFDSSMPLYSIKALADLSGYGKTDAQQIFAGKLKQTVKNGGAKLKALLAITSRSLLTDGLGNEKKLVWGVFPSSNSANNDTDVLCDFTHRLRTTVSRVQFAKRGVPLFIRHKPSPKRSVGGSANRTDPSSQIETIHLNPAYKNGRLAGKHVIVVDDCTTYGVSFGVASALLRKAGAAAVTCVALGKFGNQLRYYEIDINSSPFAPISKGSYVVKPTKFFSGTPSTSTQQQLQALIP